MTHSAPDPRAIALDLIAAVLEDGRFLDQARDTHPDLARLSARDRAFAQLLATTVLRHMGRIDAVLAGMVKMPKGRARHILRLGAAQILFLATPAHAAVATSVDLAHKTEVHRLKGLVNAVLRRLTNEGALLLSKTDPLDDIPGWLMDIWRKDWGMALAQAIAAAQLAEAPLDITVKSNPEDWAARLDAGILPTGTLRRSAGGDIRDLPGFAEGAWWIQDAASAIPAKLLAPGKNQHIVDLCAAPGGKTAQMATAGASVTAVDVSEQRLTRLRANLDRLHLSANIVQADATKWQPKSKADGVLIDAPCSATGAIRRHPDLLRLKKNAQIR
ncbi:MAG: transcription antitermination factor NusB, partial [Pseudomonadota bacterium]|nr:transcription antitermination factor NusB [Pseudomonadota bacterium]